MNLKEFGESEKTTEKAPIGKRLNLMSKIVKWREKVDDKD